jgi:oligopeptide transport system substrate-binding protein
MKSRLLVAFALAVSLIAVLAWMLAAQHSAQAHSPFKPLAQTLTLNISQAEDPLTLDPALSTDTTSHERIEQLFIGLVDLDDNTSEVRPELATSWTVSSDQLVYTFTLRSDAVWSDGHPLTAMDVRYGILRSLNPATASEYAYVLSVIKNAAEYNSGIITDPNLVGVTALNTTTLRITLANPASYALSILAQPVARPMPQWAIEAHGTPTWTTPANIVTNGAYRLTEWVQGDHMLLDKNPTYFDAANVQIEHVRIWTVSEATAWSMYLNGQLDTAFVPSGTSLNPVLRQEVHSNPVPCTYYYGFSASQPPFNNTLVRKAFIAATNRQGMINTVQGGVQRAALTFTPPGVFGYVDGFAEGVGIQYNPAQARQWLAQAGYPNGQGLPPIKLSFNSSTGHQAIAEYIRNNWYSTLGVSVTLQSVPWQTYLQQLRTGQFQIWRLGWCMDYPDAHNFLYDAVIPSRSQYGNWTNATYDSLLDQATRTQDVNTRKSLYKQAERILVETDAMMLPLYHYVSVVAAKPYLERTYSVNTYDISTWRMTRVGGTASPGAGGAVTSYHGDTTIDIPPGAVTDTVVITQSPAYGMPPVGNLTGINHVFDITAVYTGTGQPASIAQGQTYTITVQYTDAEKGPAIESTLALYYWDGNQWIKETSSQVDVAANTVSATPNHFSLWAVFGETKRVFLPVVLKTF